MQHAERRYVRKPKGAAPGAVRVDRERVLVLRMEAERLKRLLAAEIRPESENHRFLKETGGLRSRTRRARPDGWTRSRNLGHVRGPATAVFGSEIRPRGSWSSSRPLLGRPSLLAALRGAAARRFAGAFFVVFFAAFFAVFFFLAAIS